MLQIEHLKFQYPNTSKVALHDITLSAQSGQILGLLGPNGAGKSTVMAHLAGLLPVQAGQITLDQRTLADVRRSAPQTMTLAPQEYAFYPMLTVAENMACFAAISGLRGQKKLERIAKYTQFSQLENFSNTRAERLSGGLKRRLNLAIALLPEPKFLLLDEPTVGVDPQSRTFILEAIRQLADGGMGIIYTSHYMEEIEAIADHVVIMDDGRIVCAGTLDELLNSSNRILRVVVSAWTDGARSLLQAMDAQFNGNSAELTLTLAPEQTPAYILTALEQTGAAITQIEWGKNNLEQVFMTLTHKRLRDE